MDFLKKLDKAATANDSLLCVGLDSDSTRLPKTVKGSMLEFNKRIIEATAEHVCAFKINSAFYEAEGAAGIEQLKDTCEFIKTKFPAIPIILDFKRADIGNTNQGYVRFAFEYLGADAVTVNPYLGGEALAPFLDQSDKGIIILAKTSSPGSGEFQDLDTGGQKLYKTVAQKTKDEWNKNNNCLLVVGATYPAELAELRELMGDAFVFLVPGVGSQGADIEATIKAGINSAGRGLIINSSRDIIFASNGPDFAQAAAAGAKRTKEAITKSRSS